MYFIDLFLKSFRKDHFLVCMDCRHCRLSVSSISYNDIFFKQKHFITSLSYSFFSAVTPHTAAHSPYVLALTISTGADPIINKKRNPKNDAKGKHPLLIIFDINGTLLNRRDRPITSLTLAGKGYPPLPTLTSSNLNSKGNSSDFLSWHKKLKHSQISIPENNFHLKSYDFKLHQRYYYLRPGLKELLNYCFDHFRVGIWTSSLPMNAYIGCIKILSSHSNLSNTILDEESSRLENILNSFSFPNSVEEAELLKLQTTQKIEREKKILKGGYHFDWMDEMSIHSDEELLWRCMAIEKLQEEKENCEETREMLSSSSNNENSLKEHDPLPDSENSFGNLSAVSPSSLSSYSTSSRLLNWPLELLWTRRRCILRSYCGADDENFHRFKQIAIKDLSQLWKNRGYRDPPSEEAVDDNIKKKMTSFYIGPNEEPIKVKKMKKYQMIPDPFYIPHLSFGKTLASKKYKPSQTLLIDDSSYKFCFQPFNGIVIPPYDAEKDLYNKDESLLKLVEYLKVYQSKGKNYDIRKYIKENSFSDFIQNSN